MYAVKCLCRVWNVKYNNIYCVASLLAGLAQFQVLISFDLLDFLSIFTAFFKHKEMFWLILVLK